MPKLILLAFTLALLTGLSGCSGDTYSKDQCHQMYEHDYVFKDDPSGLSESEYCKTLNSGTPVPRPSNY